MFGVFKSPPFADPQLGELRRARRLWRGAFFLDDTTVPLMLSGSRTAPDPRALDIAHSIAFAYPAWRTTIEPSLFEHYAPYAEAVVRGEVSPSEAELLRIASPADVWAYTNAEFIQVAPLDGELTVEIGYRVAWDEEHTLGARLRHGQLVELCGSVLVR
jgi:Domain of unknown function (DUF6985)